MQRIFMNILLAVALLVVATPAMAKGIKLGVVDFQQIVQKSEAGQQAMSKLKGEVDQMKSDLDQRKAEIDVLRQDMEKQNLALSLEAKQDKELELKRKVRDFQDQYQVVQRRLKAEEDKATQPIIQTLIVVLQEYGKRNGYTMLMEKKSSGLVYADESVDVTNEVLVELNKAWRAKAKK